MADAMAVTPGQQEMNMTLLRYEEGQVRTLGGFNIWTPAAPPPEASWEIVGSEFSQVIEIQVRPGEVVTAEPGTMLYTSDGVQLGADMGGLEQALKRCCCAGESMFRLHLEHAGRSNGVEKVALSPSFPAKIVPIDLRLYDGLVFNRGAFLAALGKEWSVDIKMVSGPAACCFGGQGLFLNTLHGTGMVFLNAGGTVMTKVLQPGEKIVVDRHGLLAFERTVSMSIRQVGGCMVCCCAGQGLFNTELIGPGFVMVHTMSLAKFRSAIGAPAKPGANGQGTS